MNLNDCKFCPNESNEVRIVIGFHAKWVACDCGAQTATYQNQKEAVDIWNRVMENREDHSTESTAQETYEIYSGQVKRLKARVTELEKERDQETEHCFMFERNIFKLEDQVKKLGEENRVLNISVTSHRKNEIKQQSRIERARYKLDADPLSQSEIDQAYKILSETEGKEESEQS